LDQKLKGRIQINGSTQISQEKTRKKVKKKEQKVRS
jgi:hypothetical protein